ncbi:MAG: IS5 family transposase [Pirellulales bacterium]
MAQKIRTRPQPVIPKPRYRVTNWPEYNRALVGRGSVTLWLSDDVVEGWRARGGKGCVYSDLAILCGLSLRVVFNLTLRQTQGFLMSLAQRLLPGLPVPHYSTLCRRAAGLDVPRPKRRSGPVHLVVDSTGLKVFGEGEWKVRQHGYSKRRVWCKLHLGVDEATGEVLAHELTESNAHDAPILPELLAQVEGPLEQVSADKAYDTYNCHRAILAKGAIPAIPTRKGAAIHPQPGTKDPPPTRGAIVKRITEIGSKAWKVEANYHRRSLAETAMLRVKTVFSPTLKSRTLPNQKTEAAVTINCLNQFTALGMPVSVKIC